MPLNNPLFWESLSFTTAAAAIVTVSMWWFYLSPMKSWTTAQARPSQRLAGWLAVLLESVS